MVTREDIESFLDRLTTDDSQTTFEEVGDGIWRVRPGGALDIEVAVSYSPPVALLRVKVMELPADDGECNKLARRLLELNATDLVHGSYGIADQSIVLTEALELSHLDYEEFLAAYESMTLALASHIREFATFRDAR
ncbi:MAG: YbjN domain-containing protein [Gemmatimonadaceae bacterium]